MVLTKHHHDSFYCRLSRQSFQHRNTTTTQVVRSLLQSASSLSHVLCGLDDVCAFEENRKGLLSSVQWVALSPTPFKVERLVFETGVWSVVGVELGLSKLSSWIRSITLPVTGQSLWHDQSHVRVH